MLSPLSGLRHVGFQGVSNYVALCRASYPSMVWIAQLGAPGDEEKKIGGCYFERTFTRVSFGAKIHWCAFRSLAAKFLDLTRIGKLNEYSALYSFNFPFWNLVAFGNHGDVGRSSAHHFALLSRTWQRGSWTPRSASSRASVSSNSLLYLLAMAPLSPSQIPPPSDFVSSQEEQHAWARCSRRHSA